MSIKIILSALEAELAIAWEQEFTKSQIQVSVVQGDILETSADAIVSPANSFGFMDGGIDLLYTELFGRAVQQHLQDLIKNRFGGELVVGQAVTIPTHHEQFPWLISAPTMRTPADLTDTINVYLASKAALRSALDEGLDSIVFPGMGTGVGNLNYNIAAVQMRRGFTDALHGMKPVSSLWERSLDEKNLKAGLDTTPLHISGMA